MRTKVIALAVTVAILLVTYSMFFFYFMSNENQNPEVVSGRLDLSEWDFDKNGYVSLNGQWEFYKNGMTDQDELHWIHVPGGWSKLMDPLGDATYRLLLNIGDATPVYGLKTSSILLSSRIMVNGEIVGASGNPDGEGKFKAVNKPYVSFLKLQPGWNEIIIQVTNYEFKALSGIVESIYFGNAEQISKLHDKAVVHDWIAFTAFLIMGLYFVGLYTQRREDVSLIAFGMICILTAWYTATRGERIVYDLFESVPFWLYIRIQFISALGGGVGFLLYVYAAFRPFCSKWFVRIGLVVGMILILLTLGFTVQLSTDFFRKCITLYATIPLLYAVYVFVLAAFHKVTGSLYLVGAAIALNAHALIQNLNVYFAVPIYTVIPFEPFILILMLALFMSLRFSNAFRQIEELSIRLIKADKLKDDFLVRTSHEFNSPLHGIMSISQSTIDDNAYPQSEEHKENLQLIHSIANRLSQLVYDIMDFSKLKQGELIVHPIPVDVHSTVALQMRIYSFLCVDRNIQLENCIPVNMPYAMADESRFSQIISNLIDNAVKHTENGRIIVSAEVRQEMVEISVQDTGEGIDEKEIPYLFEAFKSFDSTMERRGFGLGLSIVKQLVELHRGTISVSSVKGMGSTFTFSVPVAGHGLILEVKKPDLTVEVRNPKYTFPTPHVLNQSGKHSVLIVDDEILNLKVLIDTLEPIGYNIIAVKSGYEAMEQVNKGIKIDLVILDLMMPGLSGYEVCKHIRKEYSMLELPILMVTAAIQQQDKILAFEAGANDFLTKPFDIAELKARIGSLIAMKESLSKAVDLEVAFLQSQIKPHFLYNVLNSIVASSYSDVESSRKLTIELADYLRGSFRFSNIEHRITFEEEFSLIRTYVGIEQVRFKDRIRFEHDIPEAAYRLRIPPLLLQPLVENAIRHGVGSRPTGGIVNVSVVIEHEYCSFIVEDDGIGIDSAHISKLFDFDPTSRQGVGLLNINKRLKYEYGTNLRIESELGKGTKVTIRIPIEFE
jgi:two-component system sensor histidine kinase ChiS